MKPLRSRDELLALVAQHAPSRACATAIHKDRATVLGGFTPAGGLQPYYAVRVKSLSGLRTWTLRVLIDEETRRYTVEWLDKDARLPWEEWAGVSNGKRPLMDGDIPAKAAYHRMKARRK